MRIMFIAAALAVASMVHVARSQTNTVSATNAVPPTPVVVTNAVPFLLYIGVDEDGNAILESPPQWMLDGPQTNKVTTTTIRLKFHDRLDTNELYSIDFTCPRNSAFAGWEIIEQ